MIQVTVKCDTHFVVFDGISKDVRCSALLSMLEVRLGVKIPGNARLIGNGRFIGIGESIEEVIHISGNFYSSARIRSHEFESLSFLSLSHLRIECELRQGWLGPAFWKFNLELLEGCNASRRSNQCLIQIIKTFE